MAELDRFERHLEAGLLRLADEVPTAVDAAAVARAVAAGEARRRGPLGWLAGPQPRAGGLAPVLRFALAPVALLLVVFGIVVLAERIAPAPFEGAFVGSAACEGASWTSTTGAVTLDCVVETVDRRLAGPLRMVVGSAVDAGGHAIRTGTLELRGTDATWRGALFLQIGQNGIVTGTARLAGDGAAEGVVLDVTLLSDGGIEWGLLASVGPVPDASPGTDR